MIGLSTKRTVAGLILLILSVALNTGMCVSLPFEEEEDIAICKEGMVTDGGECVCKDGDWNCENLKVPAVVWVDEDGCEVVTQKRDELKPFAKRVGPVPGEYCGPEMKGGEFFDTRVTARSAVKEGCSLKEMCYYEWDCDYTDYEEMCGKERDDNAIEESRNCAVVPIKASIANRKEVDRSEMCQPDLDALNTRDKPPRSLMRKNFVREDGAKVSRRMDRVETCDSSGYYTYNIRIRFDRITDGNHLRMHVHKLTDNKRVYSTLDDRLGLRRSGAAPNRRTWRHWENVEICNNIGTNYYTHSKLYACVTLAQPNMARTLMWEVVGRGKSRFTEKQ